jgi:hypothetical protein
MKDRQTLGRRVCHRDPLHRSHHASVSKPIRSWLAPSRSRTGVVGRMATAPARLFVGESSFFGNGLMTQVKD